MTPEKPKNNTNLPSLGFTETEARLLANLNGQAGKAWWTELSDEEREKLGKLTPYELFAFGWKAAYVRYVGSHIVTQQEQS